jgi:hypothetical protein
VRLDASDWHDFREQLTDEQAAAAAAAERLREQESAVSAEQNSASGEVCKYLAELRAAITGRFSEADQVGEEHGSRPEDLCI